MPVTVTSTTKLHEPRLSLARTAPFGLDFRILAARNEPAPFALHQKERQPVISAGVAEAKSTSRNLFSGRHTAPLRAGQDPSCRQTAVTPVAPPSPLAHS